MLPGKASRQRLQRGRRRSSVHANNLQSVSPRPPTALDRLSTEWALACWVCLCGGAGGKQCPLRGRAARICRRCFEPCPNVCPHKYSFGSCTDIYRRSRGPIAPAGLSPGSRPGIQRHRLRRGFWRTTLPVTRSTFCSKFSNRQQNGGKPTRLRQL